MSSSASSQGEGAASGADPAIDEHKPIVVYDDACDFCTRGMRPVRWFDWLDRLQVLGYSHAVMRYPEVARGELDEGIRVRFPDGSVRVGIEAVRSAAMRTPVGALTAWPLYLPGIKQVGGALYGQVARRRRRTTCEIPPPDARPPRR